MAAPGGGSVAQSDFLGFGPGAKAGEKGLRKRKRVNKNKKKNWLRHSDVKDVEEFLDDVRFQQRTAGGLLQDKADESLFFVDTGKPEKGAKLKKKDAPLHIDLILQSDSKVLPPKDISSHQVPNGRKLKRKQELQAKLEKRGILSRSEKLLQARLNKRDSKAKAEASNNSGRSFYDIWGNDNPLDFEHQGKDSWYLEQTKKSRVKHPDRLRVKPSEVPAIELVSSGSSYNPSFQSHQMLLLQAHEVELKKLKEEEKIEKQLKFPTAADAPTEESRFQELCEGLVEESEVPAAAEERSEEQGTGSCLQRERKTERQRKKEKEAKILRAKLHADKIKKQRIQSLFQLRSIQAALAKREGEMARRKALKAEKRKKEALQPRRLGRLKYKDPEIDVLLSDELPESLRKLKPEGNIATDRFKSFQKRNIIEPRERAKFQRKLKVKYVEKRAFREITL
ncbi:hypothetical protein XENTR_v10021441 [Xenopus tropicalis]|uniref:Ribosome biogenesis protein NOP53 n=1 Tax=Xenopus tropicalis TaxID=8364 RepID=F7CTZ8_XENTR|nr:ribosome biogenesis protein NOP53 [Xenopus tropicalis]KAE8585751.1 hypothetical protein XENTR_v10021441 [Xenopus tropicalis]